MLMMCYLAILVHAMQLVDGLLIVHIYIILQDVSCLFMAGVDDE